MRVAFTAGGESLDSPFDNRFGRAEKFIIYDTESDTFEVLDNTHNLQAVQGAGVQSAQHIIDSKVDELVTGNLGPKAAQIIFPAGILVYHAKAETVGEALAMYKSKAIKPLKEPTVKEHWV